MSKFFLFTIANIYNFSFGSFVMILLMITDYDIISSIFGVVLAATTLITHFFSGNMRNLIIVTSNFNLLNMMRNFRFYLALPIFIFVFLFSIFFFNEDSNLLILSYIFVLIVNWINELNILNLEIKNNYKKIFLYLSLNSIFSLLLIINLVLQFNLLTEILFIIGTINFIFLIDKKVFFNKEQKFLKSDNFTKYFKKINEYRHAFLSSFSMVIANFFSRIIIFIFIDKSLAAIIFSAYAIASFPGTMFNNSFGPIFVKKGKKLKKIKKLFISILFLLLLIFTFFLIDNFYNNQYGNLFILITSISLIGSFFMTYALYIRQFLLQNFYNFKNKVFYADIFNNVCLVALTILVMLTIEYDIYYYYYLLFSIISLINFFTLSLLIKNIK